MRVMYPAIWFLTRVVVPFVSVSTDFLFSSKLQVNLSGNRAINALPVRLTWSVFTFPKSLFLNVQCESCCPTLKSARANVKCVEA